MGLYLKIGDYTTNTCTVRVSSRQLAPVNYNGFTIANKHTIAFEGHLYADGPANLSIEMNLLHTATRIPNQEVGLRFVVIDPYSDTQTAHYLKPFGAIGGVQIEDFKFADTPLHMATEVKFSMTASAIYNNDYELRNRVSLEETVSITGEGGPDTVLATQVGLPSIYQTLADYTDVQVVQSGRVTGRTLASVGLPSPLIATSGARVQKATRDTTSYVMKGTAILLYAREYQYTFNLPTHPGTVLPTVLT